MQLQQRFDVLKINNAEIEKTKRLQKNENEKSRFFSVSVNTRRKNQHFQFLIFINLAFIYNIVIIIVSDFVKNLKKI